MFWSLALCFLGAPTQAYELQEMSRLLENAIWGWSNEQQVCQEKLREFRFNSDLTEMLNIQSKNLQTTNRITSTYRVLAHTATSITMQIEGENRMTKAGDPVIWELRFRGPDEFCWHRLDWRLTGCTVALVRCPEPDLIS
jgi:hypothetical protein